MDPYATHMPALLACLTHTVGPILEIGSGWYSTPMIHAFSLDRSVVTLEDRENWRSLMGRLLTSKPNLGYRHDLIAVPDFTPETLDSLKLNHGSRNDPWSIIFIDHLPLQGRLVTIDWSRDKSDLLIVHDVDQSVYERLAYWPLKYTLGLTPSTIVATMHGSLYWLTNALKDFIGVPYRSANIHPKVERSAEV